MTEEDIVRIEQTFAIRLPHGYRQLLKSPPRLLVALMKEFAKEHSDFEVPVYLKADLIIGQNQLVRDPEEGFVAGPQQSDIWDDELLIIGGDCGGNFYCIKANSGSSTVYEWDHSGACELEVYGESIPTYVERWFTELGELAAMDCCDDDER